MRWIFSITGGKRQAASGKHLWSVAQSPQPKAHSPKLIAQSPQPTARSGATLVELLLFLAFFGASSGVLLGFFFLTSEQRVRQQTIATVEQSGMQMLQTINNRIRGSERVLLPSLGASGTVLALQLADADLHPTIVVQSGTFLSVAEANSVKTLSSDDVTISNFAVWNTSSAEDRASVLVQFTVSRTVPLATPIFYTRRFEALVPLFPDDQENVSCSCPAPACIDGAVDWQYCEESVCTDAIGTLPCS